MISLFSTSNLLAQLGNGEKVNGLGFAGEYSYNNISDGSLYISYKYGQYWYLFSYFFITDFGYRFIENKLLWRIGGEVYVGPGLIGIHFDVFDTYLINNNQPFVVPGLSTGLVTSFPTNPSITLLVGAQFLNNAGPEFIIRINVIFDFFEKISFTTKMMKSWDSWK